MDDKLYVHATLKVRIGGYERFCEALAKMVPILEACGWKLQGAWVTVVGRVYSVIDVWEIPDANTYFDATAKMRAHPGFAAIHETLSEVVEEEQVTMVRKVPYSP
jgi:hypothetical protein